MKAPHEIKNAIRDLEISKKEILDLLTSYPIISFFLAIRKGCFYELMDRLKEIMEEYRHLKEEKSRESNQANQEEVVSDI